MLYIILSQFVSESVLNMMPVSCIAAWTHLFPWLQGICKGTELVNGIGTREPGTCENVWTLWRIEGWRCAVWFTLCKCFFYSIVQTCLSSRSGYFAESIVMSYRTVRWRQRQTEHFNTGILFVMGYLIPGKDKRFFFSPPRRGRLYPMGTGANFHGGNSAGAWSWPPTFT
jgi:hypothetical protein